MGLHFGEAFSILMRTMPYLLLRMGVYVLGAAITLAYFGVIVLLGSIFGGGVAIIVLLIGLAVFAGIFRLAQRYFLYLLKAGHIAVITELVVNNELPENVNQVQYGKDQVLSRFRDVSILFVVDALVIGAINGFNRTILRFASRIPLEGMRSLARFIGTIIRYSVGYVDEAILSYAIARNDSNVWNSAKEGVILYAQTWRPLLKAGLVLALISYVLVIVVAIPFIGIAALLPESIRLFGVIGAIVIGFLVKLALMDPLALSAIIVTFHREAANQAPNPEWEARLEAASNQFVELKNRALSWQPESRPQESAPTATLPEA